MKEGEKSIEWKEQKWMEQKDFFHSFYFNVSWGTAEIPSSKFLNLIRGHTRSFHTRRLVFSPENKEWTRVPSWPTNHPPAMEYLLLTGDPQSRGIWENNILSTVQNVIWFFDLGLVCPIIAFHFYQVLLPTQKKEYHWKVGVDKAPLLAFSSSPDNPLIKWVENVAATSSSSYFPQKSTEKKAFFGWWSPGCVSTSEGGGIPSRCCKGGGWGEVPCLTDFLARREGEREMGRGTRLERTYLKSQVI